MIKPECQPSLAVCKDQFTILALLRGKLPPPDDVHGIDWMGIRDLITPNVLPLLDRKSVV